MAIRFDASTDQLVADGWSGTVATVLVWVRIQTDRNASSDPWLATASAGGAGATRAGMGTGSDGTTMLMFDAANSTSGPNMTVGTWYCFAVVMNGTAWTLYHGTATNVLTSVNSTRVAPSSPGSLVLSPAAEWLSGDLANLKVFTRALNSTEVAAELASYTVQNATSLVRAHSFLTTSLTPDSGTGSAFTAGSTGVTAVTGPPAVPVPGGGTSSMSVAAAATAAVLPTPLAAYSFDGSGSTVADDSGNGHSWTLGGSAIRSASGHTAGGLASNGGGATATLAGPAFGQTATRTVMMWLRNPEVITQWVVRWNVLSIGSGSWGFLLLDNQIVCQARNASTFARAATARPTDGAWHHYAATYDGTNVRMYLDGTLTDTQPLTAPLRTDADSIDICEWTNTATVVDDLRMYDSALSAPQIVALSAIPVAPQSGSTGTGSSSTAVSATATARALGTATSSTTLAGAATGRTLGVGGAVTTLGATATARAVGTGTSSTSIAATAAGSAAGAVGTGSSATTITATAAARVLGFATSTTAIGATASASGTVGAASVTLLLAVAAAHDLTPPLIEGTPRAGAVTFAAGIRAGTTPSYAAGIRAGAVS